ncbi:MAG: glycogen debranching protein GlgX [Planctomycetes bacterium]|nr:glycogen debranching protein GlgX [Planctomycetota bacterium]
MRVWPGKPSPLGATWDGVGVNFALFSQHAKSVDLCLFDSPDAKQESHRIELPEQTDQVWHGYLPDVQPGQLYGYRVRGDYNPSAGHRFNPSKVMLDPYAKAIGRDVLWSDAMFGYVVGHTAQDLSFDERDNSAGAPLGVVINEEFSWRGDRRPNTPWHKTVIYETHVRGFTRQHPDVPEGLRGTFAGLASKEAIKHLQKLGVTAVELMPVHHHVDDRHLIETGRTNYWGYNTLNYFAPDLRYAAAKTPHEAVREFKQMVLNLHRAGLEVILDVVYNHTGEGNQFGPTLSLRGIDNSSYYRLAYDRRYYVDFTGCGNTLNMVCPRVLQLIMDSLRYWVTEMHVDGFRFDLAAALARELHEVDKLGAFFDIIHQDPVLSQVKLIAEPWDLGPGGYQVGNFPIGWTEWNGKYRDNIRRFWCSDGSAVSEFGTRLTGSSDLYGHNGRRPYASINFVTSHDGFTLQDLVSYNQKHNEANGEENRDGEQHNITWNCGVEGPTDDPKIIALRERQKRNFFATLLLSQGVPMIRGGDELSHSQQGNNNAYCQDSELSWLNWELASRERDFLEFCRSVVALWHAHPVFQRRYFFQGRPIRGGDVRDITWLTSKGLPMTDADWHSEHARCLGILLSGDQIDESDEQGQPITDDTMLVLFNSSPGDVSFVLPDAPTAGVWDIVLDTANSKLYASRKAAGVSLKLMARSMMVLQLRETPTQRVKQAAARAVRRSK